MIDQDSPGIMLQITTNHWLIIIKFHKHTILYSSTTLMRRDVHMSIILYYNHTFYII